MKIKLSFIFLFGMTIATLKAQTVKDIDGNVYPTISFGTQTWMKENLRVTHYRNGDVIPTTHPDTLAVCAGNAPKYQWVYEYKDSLAKCYGRLYTWYAVTDSRKVCPAGWHIPTVTDWMALRKYLRLDTVSHKTGNEPDTALYKHIVKLALNSNFSNTQGFQRCCGGGFLKNRGTWWAASNNNTDRSLLWALGPNIGMPLWTYYQETNGYAARCIKD